MNKVIQPPVLKQVFLILLIACVGGVLFWHLRNFVPALLGAYTLYILMRRAMFYLTRNRRMNRSLAAAILMILSFIVVLLPINALFGILTSQILPYLEQSGQLWSSLEEWIHRMELKYHFDVLTRENMENLGKWGLQEMRVLLGATFNGLMTVVVMYFILYFMLVSAGQIENQFYNWFPLSKTNANYLKKDLNNLIFSNALGIPLVGLFQGVVAYIGYLIAGVDQAFIWFIATCIASIIPIVGAMLVYIPVSIVLVTQDMVWQGVFVFLYGFVIVGSVDNLFRLWLQKKIGDTHPLITVFGVIVGLNLFGFIGLIFGPILISLFLVLLKLYTKEFGREKELAPVDD